MGRLHDLIREKSHQRTITITSYLVNQDNVLVEGVLLDRRFKENYLITGEKRPVGEFHHMVALILVNSTTMMIEDIDVELVTVPRDECQKIKDSLDVIRGEHITKGFTQRIQSLIGKDKSCAHLRTLLLSMSSAAIQGVFSVKAQQPLDLRLVIDNPHLEKVLMGTLVNTCYVWRENGPEHRKVMDILEQYRGGPANNIQR
jgi:hypothetical protein